jgi:threonine synthase
MASFEATPLRVLAECSRRFHCEIYGKLELFNPTGSHKDRESKEIVNYAMRKHLHDLAIASTGNAAISLVAYSYIHRIKCHVFLPKAVSTERRAQIEAYAPQIMFLNTYKDAIDMCQVASERHGFLNCNPGARIEKINGDARIGREIARKKWDSVVCPTNNGTLFAGVWKGLKQKRAVTRMIAAVTSKTELADAIAGFHRIEEPALSDALNDCGGEVVKVSDNEIREAAQLLISDGLVVEGAAAAGVAALRYLRLSRKSRICCIITGNGLKFPGAVKKLLSRNDS